MPKNFLNQHAFNGGEISPRAYGRKDVGSYRSSVRLCKNFIPQTPGAAERRPGTDFIADLVNQGSCRLVPFSVSQEVNYVLAFAPFRCYVLLDGALIQQGGWRVNSASSMPFHSSGATEYVGNLALPGHGFRNLQQVRIENVDGTLPTPLSSGSYYVRTQHTVNFHPTTGTLPSQISTDTDIVDRDGLYTGPHFGPFRFETEGGFGANWKPEGTYDWWTALPTNGGSFGVTQRIGATPSITKGVGAASGANAKMSFKPAEGLVENYIYFYTDKNAGSEVVLTAPGTGTFDIVPVEPELVQFDHPFREEELFEFDYAQDGDVLYLTHQKHFPRRLVRRSDQSWRVERPDVRNLQGPYLAENEFFPGDSGTGTFELELPIGGVSQVTNLLAEWELDFNRSKLGTANIGRMMQASDDGVDYVDVYCVDVNGASEHEKWGNEATERSEELTAADLGTDRIYWKGVASGWGTTIWPTDSKGPFVIGRASGTNLFGLEYNKVYWGSRPGSSNYITVYEDRDLTTPVTITPTGSGSIEFQGLFFSRSNGHPYGESDRVWVCIEYGYMSNGIEVTTPYYCSTDHANTFVLWHDPNLTDPLIFTTQTDGVMCHWTDDENSAKGQFFRVKNTTFSWAVGETIRSFWWNAWAGHPAIGFPRTVNFMDQRAIYAGTIGEPRTLYGSVVGFPEDFSPREVVEDPNTGGVFFAQPEDHTGFIYEVASGSYDSIAWLNPMRVLVAGSAAGLYPIQAASTREVLTPFNGTARLSTRIGTREVRPTILDEQVIYSSNAGSTIRAAGYDFDRDGLLPLDITILTDHLFADDPPKQLAVQNDPYPIIWVVTEGGKLRSCTYEKEQDVVAWAQHELAGDDTFVHSIVAVPARTGSYDEVYLAVSRTINGETRLFLERMNRFWQIDSFEMADARFLDLAISGDFTGLSVTTVAGADHLEGQSVHAICDGRASGPYTVTNGQVTLSEACSGVLTLGLAYDSIIGLLPPEIPPNTGNSVSARWKRCIEAFIRVAESHGVRVATKEDLSDAVPINMIPTDHPLADAPPLFTGLLEILPAAGYSRDADLYIASDGPHPLMLTEVLRLMEYAER